MWNISCLCLLFLCQSRIPYIYVSLKFHIPYCKNDCIFHFQCWWRKRRQKHFAASKPQNFNRLMEEQVGERFPALWGSAQQQLQQLLIHSHLHLQKRKSVSMHCWYLVLPWEILAHGFHFLKRRKNIYKKGVKKKSNLTTEIKIITF